MEEHDFEHAARRWQRRIFTFAAYFLGDAAEAEEITQEVLVRLWRHPQMLTSDRLEAWLLQVARNLCVDRFRSLRSESKVIDHSVVTTTAEPRVDNGPSPERVAAAAQLRRRIAVALSQLPEPQRSVVILREIHGLSYDAIADAVQISLSNVKVSLHRGRRRLRERLEEVHDHVAAV